MYLHKEIQLMANSQQQKIAALYIGTTVIGADEDPSRVAINGHSFITIDKILLIDVEADSVQIVERQSIIDITKGTVGEEKAFKRYITRDFFEGSEINIRLIDKTIKNSLKPSHFVKFNRGSLMKLYEYTANDNGFEDGVFGGHSNLTTISSELAPLTASVGFTTFGGATINNQVQSTTKN